MTYLKDETYYSELYDLLTIQECRWWEERKNDNPPPKYKNMAAFKNVQGLAIDVSLYTVKGERYRNKSETISGWRERDQVKDEKLATAEPPNGIRCLGCSSLMSCTDRNLHTDIDDKNDRVLFFFECSKCHKRRGYWEGGQEWEPGPYPCPKCKTNMTSSHNRTNNIITTTFSCPSCGHKETDTMDLDEKLEKPIDPNFEADRKKYCLSEKEGMDYISWTENLKQLMAMTKDQEENKETYKAIAKIKKLTAAEVQGLLAPLVEKAGYSSMAFQSPEIGKDVIVPFTAMDAMPGREEYDSRKQLKKLIQQALDGTNWRLMNDGIDYRVGYVSGRLRCSERKEDLIELVGGKNS